MVKNSNLLIICLLLLSSAGSALAQGRDTIITVAGDTIDCRIIRVTKKSLTYEKTLGGMNTTVQADRAGIKSWSGSGYSHSVVSPQEVIPQPSRWRLSASGGLGYRVASFRDGKNELINQGFSSIAADKYIRELRLGPKFSGQAHYLFNSVYGAGIDYQFFQSSGEISGNLDPQDGVTLFYGNVEDNIYINYVGPSFIYSDWLSSASLKFYAQISMGLTMYREETIYFYNPVLITGKAFGANSELGLEYYFARNIALKFNLNFYQSTISKIDVNDGQTSQQIKLEKEQKESMSRLDTGFGLNFYF